MIVIVINGTPLSGKDTFIDIACEEFNCVKHSTIDQCKVFARLMGWDEVKDDTSRKMLSDLKIFYSKYFDGPFRNLVWNILHHKEKVDVLFTMAREGPEIYRLKCWCEHNDIPFYYIFVVRKDLKERLYGNDADDNTLIGCIPDYICYNKWDNKEDYKKEIVNVVGNILKKYNHIV